MNKSRVIMLTVLVLDVNCRYWKENYLEPLKIFIKAYRALSDEHTIEILTCDDKSVNHLDSMNISPKESYSAYSQISKALAYSCMLLHKRSTLSQSRIIVLSASPEDPQQYRHILNTAFCTQDKGLIIDICKIGSHPAGYLEQVAQITDGLFVQCETAKDMFHSLMNFFLADKEQKKLLNLPKQIETGRTTVCGCHSQVVEIGHVCTICLASIFHLNLVYCKFVPLCSNCKTRFEFPK